MRRSRRRGAEKVDGGLVGALARGKTVQEFMAERSWMERAACAGHDPDLWFPDVDRSDYWDKRHRAMSICRTCEVQVDCLRYALENKERHGIWGGVMMSTARKRRRRQS